MLARVVSSDGPLPTAGPFTDAIPPPPALISNMNRPSTTLPAARRRGGMIGGLIVCLVLLGVLAWLGYFFIYADRDSVSQGELITQEVTRGPFDHIVLEQGEVESSSNTEIICEVKSRGTSSGTSILWVIDEGTKVAKGEKLIELDSSQLETQVKEDKIQVTMAEANVTTAAATLEQAKIAREEYLEGVYKTEENAIKSEMAIAEQELRKSQLALESSERLVAKGLVKSLQLDADKYAVANARNQLEAAQGRLKVLQNLTRKKMLVQFDSDIESAEAQLSALKSELMEEKTELAETEAQIEKCVMYAPSSGVVVHANKYSSRGGNAEFVVEAGATVRERQAIIRLPDPSLMQVKCKVNESRVTLIEEGMPVKISVDAIPGLKLQGRVKKVNRYAEPGSFFSSSIKEYATIVEIINPPDTIRTGMTAEAQIFVEQLADSLQIPIQGLYEHGGEMYALVQRGPKTFETNKVEIGATNDTMASIKSGLEEGDTVVLNLREHLSLMELPEVIIEDNSDMRKLGAEPRPAKTDDAVDGPSGPRGDGDWQGRDGGGRGPGAGGRPDGGGRPGGGGGRPDGGGRPGGGRPDGAGGGGMPDIGTIVTRSMERNDTDGDGKLSAEEISAIDGQYRSGVQEADADGDGSVTRAELTESIQKRMGSR
ncbi:MAG: HlyD family efflux transporter periplasmic adaptor subunit [Pirellulaceae bacterium]|nr:HlyD family efflux transporter periplasmic adaptor subunit [Pirellulaceae bacterium]